MSFRKSGIAAAVLLGWAAPGGDALAQYYPPSAYPPPVYAPQPGYRPVRPVLPVDDDDGAFYDPPMVQRQPLPPPPGMDNEVDLGPPVGHIYGDQPGASVPGPRVARPNYGAPVYQGVAPVQPNVMEPDGARPPMPISPERGEQGAAGAPRGGEARFASLPPEVRPETGPVKELPPQFRRVQVDYRTKEPAGTIIIDTSNTYLYLVLGNGKALRYGIGVGREGFTWAGMEKVSRMAEWPDWHPPEEMIERQPYLPRFMAGGPGNPLGARALYLGATVYRIHGTNQPSTIGSFVSSGCIRLTNEDVMDLYTRVKVGTHVVVLPGKPPTTAPGMSILPPAALAPSASAVNTAPLGPPPPAR